MDMGSYAWPALVAAAFMLGDVVSGFAQAAANRDISSEKMRQGLWHKASFLLVLALALGIEWASGFLSLGFDIPTFVPACVIVVLTEVVSITENISKMNPQLAGSRLLSLFRGTDDDGAGEEKGGEARG